MRMIFAMSSQGRPGRFRPIFEDRQCSADRKNRTSLADAGFTGCQRRRQLERKKEGVAYVTADWQYSAESIEALKKQDPDWKDIRPETVESVAIYISGIGSVYRLYNPNTGEHLYTSDLNEKTVLAQAGWSYESISWLNAADSSAPIYRLYNPNAGDHHYTQEKKEADYLEKQGWLLDGTVLNADSEDQIPVYRLYNPNAKSGAHHFTTDKAEYAWLAAQGWKEEGIAFYTSSADRLPKDDLPLPALPE
ncbi:hypothetical protein [Allobaculum sp. Allo2]|uniref:hypothetical protein n=1 Tax=Allobaculum sp. Allo2 TaxID=2853432 RepID=UPI001F616947|nr:hypothetical protein [Allobaculum sp. Allo2]UNT93877.1 hypothetical protein KWG61_03965 [Allobaculum sp. Allo2]